MNDSETTSDSSATEPKPVRMRPNKKLPTDRLMFSKQTLILRGTAKASLAADRGPVTNNEVAQFASVQSSTVSLCNEFWVEAGLLTREGLKVRPSEAVFEFDQASEWEPQTAGHKLAGVLGATWFGKAIITKLAIIPTTTVQEAVALLAMQCGASTEYKTQLEGLLAYLEFAGIIVIDGNTIKRGARNTVEPPPPPPPPQPPLVNPAANTNTVIERQVKPGMKVFTVALPDKESVTVEFPEDFNSDDWVLLAEQLVGYMRRWKKVLPPKALKDAIDEATSALQQTGDT